MFFNGEQMGLGGALAFDAAAVDPLECTSICASGMPGSLTTIAMAEAGGRLGMTGGGGERRTGALRPASRCRE